MMRLDASCSVVRNWAGAPVRRLMVALVLALVLALPAVPAVAQEEEHAEHHWIVLLDVSASFEQRETDLSEGLGREGYRLRNETLSLLHTLLAARRVKELEQRDDRLSVYVFGEGVERVQELSAQPVRWGNVHDPEWWQRQIPTGLGARTNYFEALRRAVEDFQDDPAGTVQHLVLISDGELDVGEQNRPPGAPPGREELDVYRDLLRRDTDPLNWLHDHGVEVNTLAVDPALSTYNDSRRQQEILSRLYEYQFGGATPLERARVLVDVLAGRIGPGERMIENEGPYVMAALAQAFNGESRSVRYDNVLDVLWKTLFPEQSSRRILPLGTNQVVVFAPREAPVQIKVDRDGRTRTLTLLYDEERDSYRIDSAEEWPDLAVNHHATSQYVTWWIRHPGLQEVDPRHQVSGMEERPISIVPVTNVRFRWRPGQPPPQVLAGEPVTLALDLVWTDETRGPAKEEWRRHLEGEFLEATGEIEMPDGSVEEIVFSPSVPADDGPDVLRLESRQTLDLEGDHTVRAILTVGRDDESPQLRPQPLHLDVIGESPLSQVDRYLLQLRQWKGGEALDPVPLRAAEAESGELHTLWVDRREPVEVVFEWWGERADDCEGVQRLTLELPAFDRTFGHEANSLSAKATAPGDRLICYRTPGVLVEPELWGSQLEVTAVDGFQSLSWHWTVDRPAPWWARYWWLLVLALLALLGLLLFLGRHRIARWNLQRIARFPLAVDGPEETLVWEDGKPKRFVLTAYADGAGAAELSWRKPGSADAAVVVEPVRASTYRVFVASGPPWSVERVDRDGRSSSRPLTRSGDRVNLLELTRGERIHLRQQDTLFTLRHQAR